MQRIGLALVGCGAIAQWHRMALAGVPAFLVATDTLNNLLSNLGLTQMENLGLLVLNVVDCAGAGVSGIELTLKQNGAALPDPQVFDVGVFVEDAAGTYFVINLPEGNTEVSVAYGEVAFLGKTVITAASTTTTMQIRPGY